MNRNFQTKFSFSETFSVKHYINLHLIEIFLHLFHIFENIADILAYFAEIRI